MRTSLSLYPTILLLGICPSFVLAQTAAAPTGTATRQAARGIVFHDANANHVFDDGEKGLPEVRVSNGRDIVTTDAEGRYELVVDNDTILFVIKPRGWQAPLNELKLPQFYYIHKPHGSPELKYKGVAPTGPLPDSVDFPLYRQQEPDQFRAILFGDPQPRNQKEIDYIAHDVIEELVGTDAAFGVTLGDITFDDLSLFKSESQAIALLGIPWYNVIGNHDINYDAQHDRQSDETFERTYGPAYYSFDYGPTHFLVLDDVEWFIEDGTGKGKYRGGIGKEQLAFIRNDLAGVPDKQMVVLLMHIPIMGVRDRQEVYRLIEKRPFCISISGHTHTHEHHFIDQKDGWQGAIPHHHIVNVTVSGSWWRGTPDERGIPHATMQDGAPNGYSIMTFDGHKYTLDYKAAGRAKHYQLEIHAPETVTPDELVNTMILVNVFNGSERSQVQMRLDDQGDWLPMQQMHKEDPKYRAAYESDQQLLDNQWIDLPAPGASTHMWGLTLPATIRPGIHLLCVKTVDMNGRAFTSRRVLRVAP